MNIEFLYNNNNGPGCFTLQIFVLRNQLLLYNCSVIPRVPPRFFHPPPYFATERIKEEEKATKEKCFTQGTEQQNLLNYSF